MDHSDIRCHHLAPCLAATSRFALEVPLSRRWNALCSHDNVLIRTYVVTSIPGELRVVIFSGGHASDISRLIHRIHMEVPGARVCGVLTERRPGKTRSKRVSSFLKNLQDPAFSATWDHACGPYRNARPRKSVARSFSLYMADRRRLDRYKVWAARFTSLPTTMARTLLSLFGDFVRI